MLNLLIMSAVNAAVLFEEPKTNAELAFEKFKAMAGQWSGTEQDGRVEVSRYQVIAAGTVVMQDSLFEGHPNDIMVTMFHMDNGRLMLTHYCVARNQPRLVAKEFSADGKRIVFEFLDGTGMKDRNVGHMDKVVWEFPDKDTSVSHWTFYKDGKETWMEKFTMKRVAEGDTVKSSTVAIGSCCQEIGD